VERRRSTCPLLTDHAVYAIAATPQTTVIPTLHALAIGKTDANAVLRALLLRSHAFPARAEAPVVPTILVQTIGLADAHPGQAFRQRTFTLATAPAAPVIPTLGIAAKRVAFGHTLELLAERCVRGTGAAGAFAPVVPAFFALTLREADAQAGLALFLRTNALTAASFAPVFATFLTPAIRNAQAHSILRALHLLPLTLTARSIASVVPTFHTFTSGHTHARALHTLDLLPLALTTGAIAPVRTTFLALARRVADAHTLLALVAFIGAHSTRPAATTIPALFTLAVRFAWALQSQNEVPAPQVVSIDYHKVCGPGRYLVE